MNLEQLKQQTETLLKSAATLTKDFVSSINAGDHKFVDNILSSVNNPTPKSKLFPYTYFDKEKKLFFCDVATHNNTMTGFIVSCDPIVGIDSNVYKQLSLLFDDQLPLNGVMQVLLIASDDIDGVLKRWGDKRVREEGVYEKLSSYKIKHYHDYNAIKDNNFKHRNYKLYFFYSEIAQNKQASKSKAKINSSAQSRNIIAFKNKLWPILDAIGVNPQDIDEPEFLSLVKEIINYPEFRENSFNPLMPLGDQITDLSTNLLVEDDRILHSGGEFITKCYQVKIFPETGFNIGRIIDLFGSEQDNMQIPTRFCLSYMIANNLPDSKQEGLKAKGDLVLKQANSGIASFTSGIADEAKEWHVIKEDNIKRQEKFLTTSLVITITAKNDEIDKCEQSLISLWRKSDMVLKSSKYFQLPSLLSICPFLPAAGLLPIMKNFDLARTALSSEPKALMPIIGEWKGSPNSGMLLTGRRGQLFAWNSFERGSNYNVSVVGESGSGKSVFLQEFVTSHLALGSKVFVIDIGRSFEKTCKILQGDFIHFGSGSKISVNPFLDIPDNDQQIKLDAESYDTNQSGTNHSGTEQYNPNHKTYEADLTSDSLNMLKFIVRKMVAPKAGTTDYQDALIAMAIADTWNQYKNETTIDKLAENLAKRGDRGKDLSVMLFEYTGRGSYGRFFAGNSNVKFNKDLTVLEFEELRERPDLGAVIMQMLSIQIVQQVYLGDRKQKFIILFDEAWYALLHFPHLLASMAKTVRKYNGSLVLGTQSLTDYFGSGGDSLSSDDKARATIMENLSWQVFLKQKADSAERASKIGLDKTHISLIKSLETIRNRYSESLIYQSDKEYFIGRLMLDPFSETLYSSSPEMFSRVNNLINQGCSTADAVEQVMRQVHDKR